MEQFYPNFLLEDNHGKYHTSDSVDNKTKSQKETGSCSLRAEGG